MNKLNDRRIIDHLAEDKTLDVTVDELNALLAAELKKPAEQIDAELVAEILKALGGATPDPVRKQQGWLRVKKHLRPTNRRSRRFVLQLVASILVVCILMITLSTNATASRWTFIQKILKPIAQTFGILVDEQPDVSPAPTAAVSICYTVGKSHSSRVSYPTLEDVPLSYRGYTIRPTFIPEGYVYVGGSLFTSTNADIFAMDFVSGDDWITLSVHILPPEGTVSFYEFEQTLESPIERQIGRHVVTFYTNATDEVQSVSWVHENAHYFLSGEITDDAIVQFIERME